MNCNVICIRPRNDQSNKKPLFCSLFLEEICVCAAVHMCYVMDACNHVRPIIFLPLMMGTSFVLVAITKLIISKTKNHVTWSHRTCMKFPFLRGGESNTLVFLLNHIIFNSFHLWCELYLKNQGFLFASETFFEETKQFLSYQICFLTRNFTGIWWITKETFLF